jgi:hypothetical protein
MTRSGTPRAETPHVTLHEIRQCGLDYLQRVGRAMHPRLFRRATIRAAREATAAVERAAMHIRAAALVPTDVEFRDRLARAIEGIEESVFWLELMRLTESPPSGELGTLIAEGQELVGMLAAAERPQPAKRVTSPRGTPAGT